MSMVNMHSGIPVSTAGFEGWDVVPVASVLAVVLIIGFAVAAVGWAIRRDF